MVGIVFFGAVSMGERGVLRQKLAATLAGNQRTHLLFDFDGTLFPLCPNPDEVRLDPTCRDALREISRSPQIILTGLTGRSVARAREMVGEDVPMAIVGSHGVEYQPRNGPVERHDFGPEMTACIDSFRAAALAFADQYADLGLVAETDKHGAVGINAASVPEEKRDAVLNAAKKVLSSFCTPGFELAQEGPFELELRPAALGKDFGIKTFIRPAPTEPVFFFCDSLGPHGTDRKAAELLNDRNRFKNGHVIMVRNGRNAPPPPEAACAPLDIIPSSQALGETLLSALDKVRNPGSPALRHDFL